MKNEKIVSIYKEFFGPIINLFLHKLDANIRYLDDGNTTFLFTTRAGVRIKKLYELYLEVNNLEKPQNLELFQTSRFLMAKSHLSTNPEVVKELFIEEYKEHTVEHFLSGLINQTKAINIDSFQVANLNENSKYFIERNDFICNLEIKKYLDNENKKFKAYLHTLIGDNQRIVIIDSGWNGTIQSLMKKIYGNLAVYGLYFGRITNQSTDRFVVANSLGLVFESENTQGFNSFDTYQPESAFKLHRHIIEDLFEPNALSVETLLEDEFGNYIALDYYNLLNEELKWSRDAVYMSVYEYIETERVSSVEKVNQDFKIAMNKLSQKIVFPTVEDVDLLGNLYRTADFGKSTGNHVLLDVKDRFDGDSSTTRVREALWSQGQIVLEYKRHTKERIKLEQENNIIKDEFTAKGTVAIITRTKDRPILLKRAARSVADQTYTNYVWVVINDGGEKTQVDEVIRKSLVEPSKIIIIHNETNIGMEAASNKAISQSDSKYIIIHDDDDSWDPTFLKKSTSFLESSKGKKYGAVVTGTWYVSESIINDEVIIHCKNPYNEWLKNIHISEMVHGNTYAPISFLFKRNLYKKVSGFDESLPVLGDWDFNLRYLMKVDIGILDEKLAYYHHRDRANTSSEYSNSVIGGISKHMEYNSIVRNKYIRDIEKNGSNTLAILCTLGYMEHDLRNRINGISRSINATIKKELHIVLDNEIGNTPSIDKIVKYQEWGKKHGITGKKGIIQTIMTSIFKKTHPTNFDETYYLKNNPDVFQAVLQKEFKSGFHHYITYGYKENRL